jgi:hypothetical protein
MQLAVDGPLIEELREYVESGTDLPQTAARRHHFVPAFLLGRFSDQPGNRRAWLRQLDTSTGRPGRTTPDSACFRPHLYPQKVSSVDGDVAHDTRIETFFLDRREARCAGPIPVLRGAAVAIARRPPDPVAVPGPSVLANAAGDR